MRIRTRRLPRGPQQKHIVNSSPHPFPISYRFSNPCSLCLSPRSLPTRSGEGEEEHELPSFFGMRSQDSNARAISRRHRPIVVPASRNLMSAPVSHPIQFTPHSLSNTPRVLFFRSLTLHIQIPSPPAASLSRRLTHSFLFNTLRA
jgi:hypothetical protein